MIESSWRKGRPALLLAVASVGVTLALANTVGSTSSAGWTPAAWTDVNTLEILTTGPEEGEHWSILWLVVIDDQLYLRLGSRAVDRIQKNTTAPFVSVKIDGKHFERVRADHEADYRHAVAKGMARKYWTDLFIRFFPHPMTVRLTPEVEVTAAGTVNDPS